MRVALAALLSTLAFVAAGCGGEDVGASTDSAASILKPGALVYWETVSDPDSEQWEQVGELLRRFPDGDKWIAMLREEVEKESDVTWPELRDALGERTVVAVYLESPDADPAIVGLTNSDDSDKTVAVVRKLNESSESGDRVVTRVVDGWVVISDKETSFDAALKGEGGRALADEETFTSALEDLPEDALSRVYVDVATAVERFAPQLGEDERDAFGMLGLDQIDFAGAWAGAEDSGARLAALVRGSSLDQVFGTSGPFTSKLLERVPGDAFAFFSFRGEGVTRQFERFKDSPFYRMGVRELENELGIKVDELVKLFEGEVAFYARPAAPIPELTLLLDAADAEQARQSADRVLRALAERSGGEVTEDGEITTARFEDFALHLGSLEAVVVLTTAKRAFADLAAPGDKLADSERYQDALEAAGVPGEYTGLAYVDLAETIELILGFADSSGGEVPPEIARNLEPLKSLVAYGTQEGDVASFLLFVEID